jgi:hypothetical protein
MTKHCSIINPCTGEKLKPKRLRDNSYPSNFPHTGCLVLWSCLKFSLSFWQEFISEVKVSLFPSVSATRWG